MFGSLAAWLSELYGEPLSSSSIQNTAEIYCQIFASLLEWPLPNGKQLLVILDGLDEASDWQAGPHLFPHQLLVGVKLAVSARTQERKDAASVKQLCFEATTHPNIAAEVDDEVKWVVEIAVKEGPIHLDEVSWRLSLATGLTRRSSAVSGVVKSAAAYQQKRLRQVGKFLYPASMTRPPVRSRANLPAVSRSLDLIAPEEIQEAILLVVQDGLGVLPEEIPQAVGQLFGFTRLGEFQASFIIKQIESLLTDGRLVQSGKWVTVRPNS